MKGNRAVGVGVVAAYAAGVPLGAVNPSITVLNLRRLYDLPVPAERQSFYLFN